MINTIDLDKNFGKIRVEIIHYFFILLPIINKI